MSNVGAAGTAQLTETMLGAGKAMTDQVMKEVKVNAEVKVAAQQQQTTMAALAMMTGIGTQLDTVA